MEYNFSFVKCSERFPLKKRKRIEELTYMLGNKQLVHENLVKQKKPAAKAASIHIKKLSTSFFNNQFQCRSVLACDCNIRKCRSTN